MIDRTCRKRNQGLDLKESYIMKYVTSRVKIEVLTERGDIMRMFKLVVFTNVVLLFSYLTFASVPSSTITALEETSYNDNNYCIESYGAEQTELSDDSAYSIGDCYFRVAEELMTYFDKNDTASSPYRNRVITVLQYADSWFSLAEISNETGAENRRSVVRSYILYFTISDQNVL